MRRMLLLMGVVLLGPVVFVSSGCRQTEWEEREYQIKMPTGLDRAETLLRQYAEGQPVGSEATDFPQIVEQVRETDPQKADMLRDGFEQLQKNPRKAAAKARELLGKL